MHGGPKYGPDFQHFDYVNPRAPQGGDVRLQAIGAFDTLNAFILKGIPAEAFDFLAAQPMGSAPWRARSLSVHRRPFYAGSGAITSP
jgi:ABC-type oligopeptide transport system substrate-binding subunit